MILTVSFIVGLVQSNPTRVALEADVPLSKFSAGWVMGPRASPTAPFQLTVAVSERKKKKTIKSYYYYFHGYYVVSLYRIQKAMLVRKPSAN